MLGKRLKQLREERGMLQKELALSVGLSQQTISLYEAGKRNPDRDTLLKIARYFDCSTNYLLGHTNERSPAEKIKAAISGDPELADFWKEISQREDLQLLFRQTRDMSPKGVRQIIRIIKI